MDKEKQNCRVACNEVNCLEEGQKMPTGCNVITFGGERDQFKIETNNSGVRDIIPQELMEGSIPAKDGGIKESKKAKRAEGRGE